MYRVMPREECIPGFKGSVQGHEPKSHAFRNLRALAVSENPGMHDP